jgi:hypothetical protein
MLWHNTRCIVFTVRTRTYCDCRAGVYTQVVPIFVDAVVSSLFEFNYSCVDGYLLI